jgi:hypothetical protein
MRAPPDHRGKQIIELAKAGAPVDLALDPREIALFYRVKSQPCPLPEVDDAYDLYATNQHRHLLDALFLGQATDAQLFESLQISHLVLSTYRYLFCDKSVFRHALDVHSYVQALTCHKDLAQYYTVAIKQGPTVLLSDLRLGERPPVDPKATLRSLTSDFFTRFQAHRGQALTSRVAQEAFKWGRAAADTSVLLIQHDSNKAEAALEDLKLALASVDHTATPDEAGLDPRTILNGVSTPGVE